MQVKTTLEGSEVQYCESLNGNLFLLKYFKYECALCSKLCSHILIADFCCHAAMCLECCRQICDQLEEIVQQEGNECQVALGECLFCGREMNPDTFLLIRDPYQYELQAISKQTVINVRRREKER